MVGSSSYLEYLMAEYYEMAERSAERLRDNSTHHVSEATLLRENEALTQQLTKIQRQMTMIERVFDRYNSAGGDQDGDGLTPADRATVDATFPLLPPIATDLRFGGYIGGVSRNVGIGDQPQALDSIPTMLPAIVPQGPREEIRPPSSRPRTSTEGSAQERKTPTMHGATTED